MQPKACFGGMLFTLGPNWNNYVFEPQAKEDTPNYYGYGARSSFGYSIGQVLDLGVYGHYAPGRREVASAMNPDAIHFDYGVETGLRLFEVMFLGVRGGSWNYRLLHKTADAEVAGVWSGIGGEVVLGLIYPVTKQSAWQVTMDMGQGSLAQKSGAESSDARKDRKLSRVSVNISYVFNQFVTDSLNAELFNSFMKTFF